MYEYEVELDSYWTKYRKQHVEKAAGLGITEWYLRKLEHEAQVNPLFENSHVELISGPNKHLAKELIERMVGSKDDNDDFHDLERLGIARDVDDYSFRIGTTQFEAAPSDNIEAIRSKPRPIAIFIDEAAFFLMKKESEIKIRQAAEHYELKSNPWVIWVSTPGFVTQGIFHDIKVEENSQYKKIQLDYKVGLEVHPESMTSIYPRDILEEAKKSKSFPREYQLVWGGGEGNIFPAELVDLITEKYDLSWQHGQKIRAIDPAFGTSKFAIIGLEYINGIIYVKKAEQFARPSPSAMLEYLKADTTPYAITLVDSAHPGLVTDLQNYNIPTKAVPFNKTLSQMTVNTANTIKQKTIRVHPMFEELINQWKAVEFNEKGHPDKKKLTFDLGDASLMGVDYIVGSSGSYEILPLKRKD